MPTNRDVYDFLMNFFGQCTKLAIAVAVLIYVIVWPCSLGSGELMEATILKEVVFAFQGITGSYIKYSAASETFTIDSKVCEFIVISRVKMINLMIGLTCTVAAAAAAPFLILL